MKRLIRTYAYDLDAAPDRVFPLLCPVREYDWISDWKCEMVYTDSGVAEPDCVFRTAFPDEPEAVWTCSRYEPPAAIDYVVFVRGSHVQRLAIRLSEPAPGKTRLQWTRTFTALTAEGESRLEEFARGRQDDINQYLHTSLRHYLATGTIWRPATTAV